MMNKKFLNTVYGYTKVKEELSLIRDWYLDSEKLGERRKLLPRGILFYGNPGEGKTHLTREYSKTFNYPIFIIEGNDDNVQDEVVKVFEKAKKEKNGIVIIDEVDKLIEKDEKLTRILMAQLDGFQSSENVLTLATCNNYDNLPEALLREGRFDRHFYLRINDNDDLEEIIKGFSKDAGIKLTENDVSELLEILYHRSASTIRSIFNNAALRYGQNCTISQIVNTADFIKTGFISKDSKFVVERNTAVHEAGHALYLYKFCKTQKFLRIYFSDFGGFTVYRDINDFENKENRIETIQSALAGLISEELCLKSHGVGCGEDLEKAYDLAFRLVNRTCINGIEHFCTRDAYYDRKNSSEHNNRIFEKKTSTFLKKNYQIVKKGLKKYINQINDIADYLQEHKEIKREDFIKILSNKK